MNRTEREESLQFIKEVTDRIQAEVKTWVEDSTTTIQTLRDRMLALEQKARTMPVAGDRGPSMMQFVAKSDQLKALLDGHTTKATIALPAGMLAAEKTAIVSSGQVLSQAQRLPGVIANPLRAKRVRDVILGGTTGANLVEFTKENAFTNNAAPQYSSPSYENVAKPESAIAFTLAEAPVRTLAHWIPVSRQALADANYLQSFVSTRLMQGLKVKEDDQLLNGSGTGGNLSGILTTGNFTAAPSAVSGENILDRILRSATAIAVDEMVADFVMLHPNDWADMQVLKSTGDGEYLLGKPGDATEPKVWGLDVVSTTAIAEGTFLVGSGSMGAQVFDREQATVQVSFEHSDYFTKNMAAILVEERLALAIYRAKAFRKGTL